MEFISSTDSPLSEDEVTLHSVRRAQSQEDPSEGLVPAPEIARMWEENMSQRQILAQIPNAAQHVAVATMLRLMREASRVRHASEVYDIPSTVLVYWSALPGRSEQQVRDHMEQQRQLHEERLTRQ